MPEMNKAFVDEAPHGQITIHFSEGCKVPATVCVTIQQYLQQTHEELRLCLDPLRLIVVASEGGLGNLVSFWQQQLGGPDTGLSAQPETIPCGKIIFWGEDKESARSVILLSDLVAAGIQVRHPQAIASLVHELGHVHDYFARGLVNGFQKRSASLTTTDWPRICFCFAEQAWSEFAAEGAAAYYLDSIQLDDMNANDQVYLKGVFGRLRKIVLDHKAGRIDINSVWEEALTSIGDLFAQMGRIVARLQHTEHKSKHISKLVNFADGEPHWQPFMEPLVRELESLGSKTYAEWTLSRIERVVPLAFHAVGLMPKWSNGILRIIAL
jgi:hypothetical protein